MAASDAVPIPRKFVAYRVTFPIHDANGSPVSGAAIDTGVQISRDGGAFAHMDTGKFSDVGAGFYFADLDTGDMAADTVAIKVDSNQQATNLVIYPALPGEMFTDTGGIGDAVWAKDSRSLTAFAFDTGIQQALSRVDTGLSETIDRILADTDTGLKTGLSVAINANAIDTGTFTGTAALANDTGALEAAISTGVWSHASRTLTAFGFDTGVQQKLDRLDTGLSETIDRILADTDTGLKLNLSVNVDQLDGDTGAADNLGKLFEGGVTTPAVNVEEIDGDTGAADILGKEFADTGIIAVDVQKLDGDTGAADRLQKFAGIKLTGEGELDTGTGQPTNTLNVAVSAISDTGINSRLAVIAADVDTGLRSAPLIANVDRLDGDTGAADVLGKFAERLSATGGVDTGTLDGTQAGTIDANIVYVNETQVQGTGDTGLNDPWRPV